MVRVQTTPPHTPLTVDHVATVGRWMASQEHWEDDKATATPPASHEEKEANTAGATGGLEWSQPPPTLGRTRVSTAAKMPTVQPPAYVYAQNLNRLYFPNIPQRHSPVSAPPQQDL